MDSLTWVDWDMVTRGYSAPLTLEFLRGNPFLVVDTSNFDGHFIESVLSEIESLDISLNGDLIQAENFAGMRLLESKYLNGVKLAFTDPPYNTKTDVFPYKDSYKHSSWMTMMFDRVHLAKNLLRDDGGFFHHIDENEHERAASLMTEVFGESNRVEDIVWKNSSKNGESYVSMQHEYIIGAVKDVNANKGNWTERKEGLEEIYKAFDGFKKKYGTDWKAIHQAGSRLL